MHDFIWKIAQLFHKLCLRYFLLCWFYQLSEKILMYYSLSSNRSSKHRQTLTFFINAWIFLQRCFFFVIPTISSKSLSFTFSFIWSVSKKNKIKAGHLRHVASSYYDRKKQATILSENLFARDFVLSNINHKINNRKVTASLSVFA